MATSVTYVGNSYSVPAYNDTGYAQGAGNLSSYLVALATGSLTLSGGAFTLTADANFGTNFGLIALYLKSTAANIAASGVIRLANTDVIAWRNAANNADLQLSVDGSNNLKYNANILFSSAGLVPISAGGTNSGTSLVNGFLMSSQAGAIKESAIVISSAALSAISSLTSATANAAASGYLRLASGDALAWRNNANNADISLSKNASDQLLFNAINVFLADGSISATGNIVFNPTTKGIKGTTTNDNAAAGNVGEQINSYASIVNFPSTTNWGDLTNISLSAGDWDVSVIGAVFNNSATITRTIFGVGTTAGNNAPNITGNYPDDQGDLAFSSGSAVNSPAGTIPALRVSLASTTTIYFKMQAFYSVGTPQIRGRISARRVR